MLKVKIYNFICGLFKYVNRIYIYEDGKQKDITVPIILTLYLPLLMRIYWYFIEVDLNFVIVKVRDKGEWIKYYKFRDDTTIYDIIDIVSDSHVFPIVDMGLLNSIYEFILVGIDNCEHDICNILLNGSYQTIENYEIVNSRIADTLIVRKYFTGEIAYYLPLTNNIKTTPLVDVFTTYNILNSLL